jgi:hypothetical protein
VKALHKLRLFRLWLVLAPPVLAVYGLLLVQAALDIAELNRSLRATLAQPPATQVQEANPYVAILQLGEEERLAAAHPQAYAPGTPGGSRLADLREKVQAARQSTWEQSAPVRNLQTARARRDEEARTALAVVLTALWLPAAAWAAVLLSKWVWVRRPEARSPVDEPELVAKLAEARIAYTCAVLVGTAAAAGLYLVPEISVGSLVSATVQALGLAIAAVLLMAGMRWRRRARQPRKVEL